jgi:hypothetical protein
MKPLVFNTFKGNSSCLPLNMIYSVRSMMQLINLIFVFWTFLSNFPIITSSASLFELL